MAADLLWPSFLIAAVLFILPASQWRGTDVCSINKWSYSVVGISSSTIVYDAGGWRFAAEQHPARLYYSRAEKNGAR
jgi:hypothetical protein